MKETNQIRDEVVELEWVLRRISSTIKQKGREILNDFPITPPQFVALQWLKEHGDMTIGELSAKMYIANSTMTDLVDRMEKAELVQRVRSTNDRRVVQVHLLDKGRDIIDRVIRARQQYLQDVVSQFDTEELKAMKVHLTRLYNVMEKGELKE